MYITFMETALGFLSIFLSMFQIGIARLLIRNMLRSELQTFFKQRDFFVEVLLPVAVTF